MKFSSLVLIASSPTAFGWQIPLGGPILPVSPHRAISEELYAFLERTARLVDITYCVGTTGLSKPFTCASRCSEFPTLRLVTTWNTGSLVSESHGYIALDHRQPLRSPEAFSTDQNGIRTIVVAFRGTYSISETVTDLSSIPQPYVPYQPSDPDHDGPPIAECSNCTVHAGFMASWVLAREEILPVLKQLRAQHPDSPIHLIGHSLGGVVAVLAALDLKAALGWERVHVTTFGEPRLGNEALSSFVNSVLDATGNVASRAYHRVTHANDPVPLLPPQLWGYQSHGGELYIEKGSLPPTAADVIVCVGNDDETCIAQGTNGGFWKIRKRLRLWLPSGWRRWGLWPSWDVLAAHRDYFWRMGMCIPDI